MQKIISLIFLAASALTAGVPTRPQQSVDYQVYFIIGQSLAQSSAFPGDSATINDRSHDDQILDYMQLYEPHGLTTLRTNWLNTSETSIGFNSGFARELYAQGERNIVIMRYCVGGHSITAFMDPARRLVAKPGGQQDLWPKIPDWFDERLARLTKHGDTYTLRAMVMWQGSSDRSTDDLTNNYGGNLDRLKEDYRVRYPGLKWLQVVSPNWGGADTTTIQTAQRDSSDADADAVYIESDPALGSVAVFSDGTHPDAISTERASVQAARMSINNF